MITTMLRDFRKLHKTHHKAILIHWALNTSVFPYNDEFSSIWFVKMFCTSLILDHDNYPSGKGQALDFEKSGFTINPTASCTESQHAYEMRLSRNSTKCFLARTYVTGYNYIREKDFEWPHKVKDWWTALEHTVTRIYVCATWPAISFWTL